MRAGIALAAAELRMLTRDTTAWATAVALPLAVGVAWALNDPPLGQGWAAVIVLQLLVLLVFTLHTVGTMTLAARRQQLILKRWRSSPASDLAVLVGTIAVPAVLLLGQAAALTAVTVVISGERPHSIVLLCTGVLAAMVMVAALTFVAAAFTRSSEHAMITTLPLISVLLAGGFWALDTPLSETPPALLAVPGAASIRLLQLAWSGPPADGGPTGLLSAAAPPLLVSLLLAAAATLVAVRLFRWEPRT